MQGFAVGIKPNLLRLGRHGYGNNVLGLLELDRQSMFGSVNDPGQIGRESKGRNIVLLVDLRLLNLKRTLFVFTIKVKRYFQGRITGGIEPLVEKLTQ